MVWTVGLFTRQRFSRPDVELMRQPLAVVVLLLPLLVLPAADRPFGIDRLPPLTTSTVIGSPEPPPPYRVKRVYPNFSPSYPIMAKAIPGTDQLLVITETLPYLETFLYRIKDDPAVTSADAVKLMDTKGVAYDFAFHPKFAENGFIYVGWNTEASKNNFTRITRFHLDPKPPYALDLASARTIIEWPSHGHNGGAVCFGADGMLYVTSGDGTSDSDLNLMGQRTDALLSKVLRIDVDHPEGARPYSSPPDNPFVGNPVFRPETWAYGLRNPWRITCDTATGQIWVGNNGQDLWEQAYLVRKGANYGWSVVEGGHEFYPNRQAGPTPISKPTVDHPHSEFRSLTGGIVYRGSKLPDLVGAYIYGDYSTGRIWAVKHDGDKILWHKELARTTLKITAFGADSHGELIICDHQPVGQGALVTLEPTPADHRPSTFPKTLSASGLFESVKGHRMVPGVIPYSVNAPFWSDGLHKERFLALPPEGKISYTRTGGWVFPDRTVLVKSFAAEGEPGKPNSREWVETRFLTKQDGEWFGYSYAWNADQSDAVLIDAAGSDRPIMTGAGRQTWHYPSRTECMTCHSRAANFVLGLCELQMNKEHGYPSLTPDNQIRVLEHLRLFEVKPKPEVSGPVKPCPVPPPEEWRALVDPYDTSKSLDQRARSWLHTNCGICHVENGGGNARMELGFMTSPDKMRVLDVLPMHTTFGLTDARLIARGHPERSVLLHRVGMRGPGQMPPASSNRVDEKAVELLRTWIAGMK
jgi:uncharacterized repeat protein (TIGR03806 family)